MASVILDRESAGKVIGQAPPAKYSFWTSITSKARLTRCFVPQTDARGPPGYMQECPPVRVREGGMRAVGKVFARLAAGPLHDHPIFKRVLTTQVSVSLGQQVTSLALPTIGIIFLNAGPMEIGILAALPWVSSPLLGPIAGAVVDRFPRRPIMVAADTGRFLCLLAIASGLLIGELTLYQLYVIAFLFGSLGLFFDIAYQAYLPANFTHGQLLQANSRVELARSPALVGGAALAGLVISGVGPARALFGAAFSYLFSGINLAAIKVVEHAPAPHKRSLLGDLGSGLVMVARDPILRSIATATAVSNLGVFIFSAVSLVFAYRSLHLSAGLIGFIVAAGNLGFLIGAAAAPWGVRRLGLGRTLALSQLFLAFSLFFAPLALFGMPVVMLSGSLLLQNLHTNVYVINQITLRQSITPREIMGRMNATMRALIVGSVPIGSILGGYLGTTLGLPQTMVLGAAIALLAPLFLLAGPVIRLRATPHRPAEAVPVTAAPAAAASPATVSA
ncbi:MAG: MFS transporter [Chloroflexi bacterium]|nr:MAG: MFS transporter [Chloroflexota bacterium]